MTEQVYACHHGLIFRYLITKNFCQEQNLNFTCDNLREMYVESQKVTFIKNSEKLFIFKSLSQLFGLMHFKETWHIYLMVLFCFPEYICKDLLQQFWRECNPNLEKWINTKRWPCPDV